MTLTSIERLTLINQYLILEHLNPKDAAYYAEMIEVLRSGYEGFYPELFSQISEDGLTEKECREVEDILDMFCAIDRAYNSLDDKAGINEYRLTYHGFDGNNDKQHSYTRFLEKWRNERGGINNHWPQIETLHVNSHSSAALPVYQQRLAEWKKCANPERLTKEDLIRITSLDPDNA